MTNYNDGKIHGWNGGDCPVHPQTLVKVFFRNDVRDWSHRASHVGWLHHDQSDDIVAFQVVKEYKEPMVVWINMYKNGFGTFYKTEQEALFSAVYSIDRVAVKFIEVK